MYTENIHYTLNTKLLQPASSLRKYYPLSIRHGRGNKIANSVVYGDSVIGVKAEDFVSKTGADIVLH